LYIADFGRELKIEIEGIAVGSIRIWNLAYADDIGLLAKNRLALIEIMNTKEIF